MAIDTLDKLVAALPKAQRAYYTKVSSTSTANQPFSLFGTGGTPPAGSAAGSLNGALCDYTTTGALGMRNPGAGNTLYLGKASGVGGGTAALLMYYDRLWHNSAVVCNITTDQLITQPALGRSTDGVGVEIWAEAWTAWGAAGTTFTVTYTNTAGTSGKVATYVWPAGAPVVGQAFRFTMAAGDNGVTSIQKISLTPSTGGAGNLGLFLVKPIGSFGYVASAPISFDPIQLALGTISSSACVSGIIVPVSATTGQPAVDLTLPEG